MFYRVTVFVKDDNRREVIVKAAGKAEAMAKLPAAKSFLFPGENTDEYKTFVSEMHLDIAQARIPHWRITVIRPGEVEFSDWDEVEPGDVITLEAGGPEEAIRLATEGIKHPVECYAKEIPVEELIAEQEYYLRYRIKEDYIFAKFGDLPIKEFSRLMRDVQSHEKNKSYYDAIQYFLSKTRLRNALERSIDLDKISAAEYNALISRLPLASDREAFEKILNAAKEKYGKGVNQ